MDFAPYRYLVVDDNRHMVRLIGEVLKGFGAQHIEGFTDPATALQHAERALFDVLLVDYLMEPINGIEFLRRVRRQEAGLNRHARIIVITAYTDKKTVMAAMSAGANAVIAKPVSPAALLRHLAASLFNPVPFIISPEYVGPARAREPDRSWVRSWTLGEALPAQVRVFELPSRSRDRA